MRTITRVGYYHPSNANWNYQVFLITDKTGAKLYRSTFGEEHKIIDKYNINQLFVSTVGLYKWSDIKEMKEITSYTGKNY